MQVTRGSDYAIRGVIALARRSQKDLAMSAEIAEQEKIPAGFLAKIFRLLALAGVLKSSRGARGGFMLARPPEQITVWDIIVAVEGKINLNVCLNYASNCDVKNVCPMYDVWTNAQNAVEKIFRDTTIAMLVAKEAEMRARAAKD